ncbi:transposase [Epilithonimonas pallida]|uniref:Transposase n=1 Tax=Epilithonimonas pallida TaxID=373671 RepID=A0ABY1R2X9_9FLAO|nr:transposase [Epilithonimonas pallida]SMP92342.1 hypothetical protein SAMN05421679_1042 [Epilithonimonas pallida]
MNFKNIHIGQIIEQGVTESGIELSRICSFLKCTEEEVREMYLQKSIEVDILLKWSKLLEYDFFRMYSQHLILYAPPAAKEKENGKKLSLPHFRKNIYTKEVIDFILGRIQSGAMTKTEVMERYKIPKTTLYKWIIKHKEQKK